MSAELNYNMRNADTYNNVAALLILFEILTRVCGKLERTIERYREQKGREESECSGRIIYGNISSMCLCLRTEP